MRKMKRFMAAALAVVCVMGAAGCAAANSDNDKKADANATTAAEGTKAAEEKSEALAASSGGIATKTSSVNPYTDELKIAWVPSNATEANGTAWGTGIGNELSYWSNVTYNIFDGETNADKQIQIIYDLIAQEYDGIIFQPYNSATTAAAVADAEKAGIPVVCINIDAETPHAGLVAMTDYEAGYAIGEEIAESLGGSGNVVVIQAKPGATRGENLEEGFQASMANHPDIKILDEQTAEWNMEKANTVMQDYLNKYGDQIDAVFCHNDQMAEGAGMACQNLDYKDILIWGANGETKALEYIEQDIITGTVYTNCYDQGATAARLLMMYLGSNIDTSTFTETPVIKMPPMTITKENVGTIGAEDRW
jgi:ribose transport system substrate-binding protein